MTWQTFWPRFGSSCLHSRGYSRANENLLLRPLPLKQLIAEHRLTEMPGIGDALGTEITRLHETGVQPRLEGHSRGSPKACVMYKGPHYSRITMSGLSGRR